MSGRPTVLFLTHRTPYPPDKGDRICTFNVLRFLSAHADVHLACLADEPVSPEQIEGMGKFAARVGVVPLASVGREMFAIWPCLAKIHQKL